MWSILWLLIFSDKPKSHKFITDKEREYFAELEKNSVHESDNKAVRFRCVLQ